MDFFRTVIVARKVKSRRWFIYLVISKFNEKLGAFVHRIYFERIIIDKNNSSIIPKFLFLYCLKSFNLFSLQPALFNYYQIFHQNNQMIFPPSTSEFCGLFKLLKWSLRFFMYFEWSFAKHNLTTNDVQKDHKNFN